MIIGFCGGTGSGKSVLVKYAYDKLGPNNSSIISLDQYYKDFSYLKFEERCNINFDHPSSIDYELITNQLSELKNGNPVHIPIYSYKKHKRLKKTEISYPKKFILVDGILIFSNKKLLKLFDKKIYIECEKEKRASPFHGCVQSSRIKKYKVIYLRINPGSGKCSFSGGLRKIPRFKPLYYQFIFKKTTTTY